MTSNSPVTRERTTISLEPLTPPSVVLAHPATIAKAEATQSPDYPAILGSFVVVSLLERGKF